MDGSAITSIFLPLALGIIVLMAPMKKLLEARA